MTERPIIFSGEVVRAILDGRKTQTRRVVKPQPRKEAVKAVCVNGWWMWERWAPDRRYYDGKLSELTSDKRCPYGQPGDRLWVRETYWSDKTTGAFKWYVHDGLINVDRDRDHAKLRPSLFMARNLSRITLEIIEIRVQRLQEISEEDAIAEGAQHFQNLPIGTPFKYGTPARWSMGSPENTDQCLSTARYAFGELILNANDDAVCFMAWSGNHAKNGPHEAAAELIAALRNAAPALIEELEALRAYYDILQEYNSLDENCVRGMQEARSRVEAIRRGK